MFDNLLINGIILFFPYLVYLFYISTDRRLNTSKKNSMQFFINIIAILLLVKYGRDRNMIIVLLNIPLFFTIVNRRYLTSILIDFAIIMVSNVNLINAFIIILVSIFLILIKLIVKKYNDYLYLFMLVIAILNILVMHLYISISAFIILLLIFNIMYKMGNDIIGFNQDLNELEKEKEVRTSLFKITHEIKNPIAVVKAYLDMFDIDNKKRSIKYINIMKSEIDRLLCLLEDFMLVNKNNINCDIMDINLLLEEKVKNINDLLNVRHVNINYEISDEELYIYGDYNRLSQVFINLIKNSIEANSANVSVKCYTEGMQVIVSIKDDGIGINTDTLDKIKEPFYTTKLKGTGLGVSLSNEIIEAHNGTLIYSSEYGHGTSVKVMLPLYEIV